jgi:hypothetical protein
MPLVEPVTTTVLLMLFSLKWRCCGAALSCEVMPKAGGLAIPLYSLFSPPSVSY